MDNDGCQSFNQLQKIIDGDKIDEINNLHGLLMFAGYRSTSLTPWSTV